MLDSPSPLMCTPRFREGCNGKPLMQWTPFFRSQADTRRSGAERRPQRRDPLTKRNFRLETRFVDLARCFAQGGAR